MRTRFVVVACVTLLGVAFYAGCEPAPLVPPPPFPCPDGGCELLTNVTGNASGGGGVVQPTPSMDAGITDAAVADGGTVMVSGSVTALSTFPPPSTNPSASAHPATGWTVEVVGDADITALTDGNGDFQLASVPTSTSSDIAGSYYGLLARPVGQDLGTYQLFPVGGAANLTAVDEITLQAALAGTTTVDSTQSQVVVYVVDSLSVGGHAVQNVVVQPVTDLATIVYDATGGVLSPSGGSTGPEGVAVILNISPGSGSNPSRSVSLQAMHSGTTQTFNVQVFAGVVSWVTILVAD